MLTIHHLYKAYGLNPILEDVTFSVNSGERVGLIGPNGSGKSTLLRLIVGQEQPDKGSFSFTPANLRLGYLAQGFDPDPQLTLRALLGQYAADLGLLEAELAELAVRLTESPGNIALEQRYDDTLERLTRADRGHANSLLGAFDLSHLPDDTQIGQLSGGQKTRLSLVLILLSEPQLLLLDEPTNHLDIEMLEWLETWLARYDGAALVVSHDRAFLDRTVTSIVDLNPATHTVREYAGNYSDYLEQFLLEREKQWSAFKDQEYEIRRMEQDIARTREQSLSVERSTTPRQPNVRRLAKKVMKKAKSREKKLDRYVTSAERVEKPSRSWQMKLELDDAPHLGKDVMSLTGLSVGYQQGDALLEGVELQVVAGTRIIVTGPNGAGKTTLLRTIAGELMPLAGTVRLGASVRLGYMSQEQELSDPALNGVQTIQAVTELNETDVRSFLHYFLFSGEDSLRPSADLSFGERARLSLALLVARGCNVLLLDEPINHLDIPSRSRFEEALSQFEGTILAVVHDRYFIDSFGKRDLDCGQQAIVARVEVGTSPSASTGR